jgi:hypothetical protein
MGVDRVGVQRVDLRRLRRSAGRVDLLGDHLQGGAGAAGEMDGCPLAGEGPGDRPTDRAATSVHHGVLAFEQHLDTLLLAGSGC